MKNIFKRFEGLGINLKDNTFLKARLKLTIFYSITIIIILISFSIASYFLFSSIAKRNLEYEDDPKLALIEQSIINKSILRLENILLISDSTVIIISSILGYYLAGKTLKPIQETMEKQKRFVADSAHELRTPLAIMKTGIEATLASKKQTLKDYKELNKDLLSEIDNLINLTNNLLFLSNADTKKQTVNFEKVDISSICLKQVKFMEKYAASKDIKLIYDIKKSFYIKGDKEKLNRMIANLLKNSIDYNLKGGSVTLTIENTNHNNNIVLKLVDTGIGINKKDLKHVFDRFYKADKSRHITDESGAGLGLSIVKEIANLHKIPINIQSEVGKGTTVTLIFKSI